MPPKWRQACFQHWVTQKLLIAKANRGRFSTKTPLNHTEGRWGPKFPSSRIQMTVTLSEISQADKDEYHTISYCLGASQLVGVKNPPANAGDIRDASLIPGSGRSPGGGPGNPLQYHITYMQNLKKKKEIFTKQKQTQRLKEWIYGYQEGRIGCRETDWEFGIDVYTLLCLK